jgi:hypothetical protein
VRKPEGKQPLRRRRNDKLKIYLQVGGQGAVDCTDTVQDRDGWRDPVNTAMDHRIPQNAGNFLNNRKTIKVARRTLLHILSYLRVIY